MSAPEQQAEQRSSVKLTRNAKGEAQWEVKVVATDETPSGIEATRQLAVQQYRALEKELGPRGTPVLMDAS